MKLKRVADDDPSADYEVHLSDNIPTPDGLFHRLIKIPPREKSNAEIAMKICGNCNAAVDRHRQTLDAVDEKIAPLKERLEFLEKLHNFKSDHLKLKEKLEGGK